MIELGVKPACEEPCIPHGINWLTAPIRRPYGGHGSDFYQSPAEAPARQWTGGGFSTLRKIWLRSAGGRFHGKRNDCPGYAYDKAGPQPLTFLTGYGEWEAKKPIARAQALYKVPDETSWHDAHVLQFHHSQVPANVTAMASRFGASESECGRVRDRDEMVKEAARLAADGVSTLLVDRRIDATTSEVLDTTCSVLGHGTAWAVAAETSPGGYSFLIRSALTQVELLTRLSMHDHLMARWIARVPRAPCARATNTSMSFFGPLDSESWSGTAISFDDGIECLTRETGVAAASLQGPPMPPEWFEDTLNAWGVSENHSKEAVRDILEIALCIANSTGSTAWVWLSRDRRESLALTPDADVVSEQAFQREECFVISVADNGFLTNVAGARAPTESWGDLALADFAFPGRLAAPDIGEPVAATDLAPLISGYYSAEPRDLQAAASTFGTLVRRVPGFAAGLRGATEDELMHWLEGHEVEALANYALAGARASTSTLDAVDAIATRTGMAFFEAPYVPAESGLFGTVMRLEGTRPIWTSVPWAELEPAMNDMGLVKGGPRGWRERDHQQDDRALEELPWLPRDGSTEPPAMSEMQSRAQLGTDAGAALYHTGGVTARLVAAEVPTASSSAQAGPPLTPHGGIGWHAPAGTGDAAVAAGRAASRPDPLYGLAVHASFLRPRTWSPGSQGGGPASTSSALAPADWQRGKKRDMAVLYLVRTAFPWAHPRTAEAASEVFADFGVVSVESADTPFRWIISQDSSITHAEDPANVHAYVVNALDGVIYGDDPNGRPREPGVGTPACEHGVRSEFGVFEAFVALGIGTKPTHEYISLIKYPNAPIELRLLLAYLDEDEIGVYEGDKIVHRGPHARVHYNLLSNGIRIDGMHVPDNPDEPRIHLAMPGPGSPFIKPENATSTNAVDARLTQAIVRSVRDGELEWADMCHHPMIGEHRNPVLSAALSYGWAAARTGVGEWTAFTAAPPDPTVPRSSPYAAQCMCRPPPKEFDAAAKQTAALVRDQGGDGALQCPACGVPVDVSDARTTCGKYVHLFGRYDDPHMSQQDAENALMSGASGCGSAFQVIINHNNSPCAAVPTWHG